MKGPKRKALNDDTKVDGKKWKEWKKNAFDRDFYASKAFQDLNRKDRHKIKVLRIAQLD